MEEGQEDRIVKNGVSPLLGREFKALLVALNALDGALRWLVSTAGAASSGSIDRRRDVHLSQKARALLVLQGRYISYMRQVKLRQEVQLRNVRVPEGCEGAV